MVCQGQKSSFGTTHIEFKTYIRIESIIGKGSTSPMEGHESCLLFSSFRLRDGKLGRIASKREQPIAVISGGGHPDENHC
jgi:hypothetical protein